MDKFSEAINSKEHLGQIIKQRRKEMNISQQDVARFCNLSHTGIGKIENGLTDVKFSTLEKLFKILGLEIHIRSED